MKTAGVGRRTVVGFWHVAYHTLFFLDLQLSAEGWGHRLHSTSSELDPAGRLPERTYTKDELRTFLRHCREKSARRS